MVDRHRILNAVFFVAFRGELIHLDRSKKVMGMGEDAAGVIELRPAWKVAQEKAAEKESFDREIIVEETKAKGGRLSE